MSSSCRCIRNGRGAVRVSAFVASLIGRRSALAVALPLQVHRRGECTVAVFVHRGRGLEGRAEAEGKIKGAARRCLLNQSARGFGAARHRCRVVLCDCPMPLWEHIGAVSPSICCAPARGSFGV